MTIKNFSPYKTVKEVIAELKQNENKVISGRFGIDTDHKTLSCIGKELKLSRERIRQIEREGLKKMAKMFADKNSIYLDQIIESFEKSGGITNHEKITEKFLEESYWRNKNEFNSLHLILSLMPQIIKIEKTKELEAGWMLASISKDDAVKIINKWVLRLKKSKKPQAIDVLVDSETENSKYQVSFLSELPHISKKLVKTESGFVGLASWPEVNPRNVRDKIYFILKKIGKPMHFDDISKKITEQSFDKKNIVKATVHNELIADPRFVLVGRGIYGLKEWGYNEGTVAEIIKSVLSKEPNGLEIPAIIDAVLKQRLVKKNTILINLQTKPLFKKISKDKYVLA